MVKECYYGSKKVESIHVGSQNTNCLTYIPEDIKLDLDPLNTTVVGSPTINKGVVSGFSTANYLKINDTVPLATATTWEKVVKFTFATSTNNQAFIASGKDSSSSEDLLGTDSSNHPQMRVSVKASEWIVHIYGSTTLTAGKTYWIKGEFTGSAYNLYLSTTGEFKGEETLEGSVSSTTKCLSKTNYIGSTTITSYQYPPTSSIDLSQSYIKINGEIWWQGGTGLLTLKAGSKVYVPNGFEEDGTTYKFDEVVIEGDVLSGFTLNDNNRMSTTYYKGRLITAMETYSGSTTPTDLTDYHYDMYYNTAENKCYYCIQVDGVWKWEQVSLPLGLVTRTKASGYTAITQVFNGFGYIGSHTFALPGIKGLILDGFKENGTYKNKEINVVKVLIFTDSSTRTNNDLSLNSTSLGYGDLTYNSSVNQNQVNGEYREFASVGKISISDGKITSLTPREVESTKTTIEVRRVYKGSQLIWGYDPSEVIFQSSTPGTYIVDIATSGYYNVAVVGGGSGGAYVYSSKFSDGRASGGSGAGFVGIVYLTAGVHTIKVGAGGSGKAYESNGQSSATSTAGEQSAIDSIIVANGGGSAKARIRGASQTAGSGGTLSYDSSKVQSYSLAKNGNAGTTIYESNITGGASVYGGYGKGGNAGNRYTTSGSNGYVLISSV